MSRSVPTPALGSDVWGKMLNDHLAQTNNATNGAFNSFDKIDDANWEPTCRPKISTLTLDDIGKTYLNKKTGNWHEVYSPNGSTPMAWKVLNQSVLNILDYGGIGDGVFNNLNAINACLAITICSKIYFPTGIYAVENGGSSIHIPSGKTLIGDGGLLSEIKNVSTGQGHFLAIINSTDITFDSIYINGNIARGSGSTEGSTLEIANRPYAFEPIKNNVVIKNCVFAGSGFCTIGANNAHKILIDGCKFINGRDSGVAAVAGSSEIKVVNSSFDASCLCALSFSNAGTDRPPDGSPEGTPAGHVNYDLVTQVRNVIVTNNYIEVGKNYTHENEPVGGFGVELDGCKNIVISNNIINITNDGLYGIFLISSGTESKGIDYNDINITGNTITNHSINEAVGINITASIGKQPPLNEVIILNDPTPKNIKITDNILISEVTATGTPAFNGIRIESVNNIIISGNIIQKIVGSAGNCRGINVFANIPDNYVSITVNNNHISEMTTGIDFNTSASGGNHVAIITNNVCDNSQNNLAVSTGWNAYLGNNYLKEGQPNYMTAYILKKDVQGNDVQENSLRENSW